MGSAAEKYRPIDPIEEQPTEIIVNRKRDLRLIRGGRYYEPSAETAELWPEGGSYANHLEP